MHDKGTSLFFVLALLATIVGKGVFLWTIVTGAGKLLDAFTISWFWVFAPICTAFGLAIVVCLILIVFILLS